MTYQATNLVFVVFDAPVDGTMLDADFLMDDDTATPTAGFVSQVDPVTVLFVAGGNPNFSTGESWSLQAPQTGTGIIFPQSGTCS